jgi:plasmid stabilization system protein ParE
VTRCVRRHRDFEADFVKLLQSLVTRGDEAWIERLLAGVVRASRMLAKLPGVGTVMARNEPMVMRKLILPHGPYVAWYVYNEADARGDVWLVRLFHARQRRPLPRPGRWLGSR